MKKNTHDWIKVILNKMSNKKPSLYKTLKVLLRKDYISKYHDVFLRSLNTRSSYQDMFCKKIVLKIRLFACKSIEFNEVFYTFVKESLWVTLSGTPIMIKTFILVNCV